MNIQLMITLLVLLFLIIGFLSGKFKLGLVAMTATTILCATGVLTFNEAFSYLGNNNVVMVGGMFILSGALSKTSLVSQLRTVLMKRSGSGIFIIFVYMIANAILIQFSMPTALITMMLPFMAAFDKDSKVQPTHLLFPGAVLAHCFQGLVPGAWFAMINGLLEANGATQRIGMLDYTKMIAIPALLVLLYVVFIAWRAFPAGKLNTENIKKNNNQSTLSPEREKLVYIVFIVNMLGILFANYLPFPMHIVPVICCLFLFYIKLLDMNDLKNFINLDILFMLAGVLPLGVAMQKTGAGTVVANFIMNMLGGNPKPIVMLIAFYFAGALLTQFMSNTATQNIFAPLAIVTAVEMGLDPRAFAMAIFAGCTAAMLTPAGSPSCAIAFGAGQYRIKDVLKSFLPIWFLFGFGVTFIANLIFPLT